ncbi:hypothetical protein DAI12_00175 [Enterococcus faecalis]|nr:hypothetical protein DAI11_17445 [Enterococcus faecalis]PTN82925.1 hypothetical protein DAI10_17745 [Enterococcus faecalis]PTN92721.1 hypothetical protein DAI12_00175 [Enterococcus faecalis]
MLNLFLYPFIFVSFYLCIFLSLYPLILLLYPFIFVSFYLCIFVSLFKSLFNNFSYKMLSD